VVGFIDVSDLQVIMFTADLSPWAIPRVHLCSGAPGYQRFSRFVFLGFAFFAK